MFAVDNTIGESVLYTYPLRLADHQHYYYFQCKDPNFQRIVIKRKNIQSFFLQISFILWTFPIPYHGLKVGTYYIPTIINLGTYYGNFNAI